MMLTPGFQVHLNEKVLLNRAVLGKFDGQTSCLAFATSAGKILLHNPHESNVAGSSRQSRLNINKQITAVSAGPLLPNSTRDVLLIGTPNFLQCYDVEHNKDVFFKDVADGVNCMVVGSCGTFDNSLVIVGGNCSVQGFDATGREVLWTVTGGNVTALALADIDEDGSNELLVGSDDADIRIYKDDELVLQIPEADVVTALVGLGGKRFAYALRNGTVGVYQDSTRLWRVKSKHTVSGTIAFDLNNDGSVELISGWSNGKVEARQAHTGDVVARDNLGTGVAALLTGQLRDQQGELELLAVSSEGQVRGYQAQHKETQADIGDVSRLQQALIDLAQKKQELVYELSSYQNATGKGTPAVSSGISTMIPADTRVDSAITLNKSKLTCELSLQTNNETVIKAAIIFGEQVFDGESLLVHPPQPSSSLTVQLTPAKDALVMLLMKVLVGSRTSQVYHVFELEMELPKYAMYAAEERALPSGLPSSHVCCVLQHPVSRVASWIKTRFATKASVSPTSSSLEAHFTSMRTQQPLALKAAAGPAGLKVWLHCGSMELAGELLQDLASYLGVDELSSTATFPAVMEQFRNTLSKVEACSAARAHVEGGTATLCANIKACVVRSEDARLLGDMGALKRQHRRLADLNRDMWVEHDKRAANQQQLVDGLKSINLMIQQAARLRVGAAASKVVAACRAAIKANNLQALNKVVAEGDTTAAA